MNSATAGAVRKLKDSGTGAYVWQPGLQPGQPNLLLGYPVAMWEDMPDIAGGAFLVAFGDFRRGYLLADRTPSGLLLTLTPRRARLSTTFGAACTACPRTITR
jgi:HK97 family phage major capsid protein